MMDRRRPPVNAAPVASNLPFVDNQEPIRDSLPRVLVVGMNKTGTSTMKGCFQEVGWVPVASPKTMSGVSRLVKDIIHDGNYESTLELIPHFLAFEDRPWNVWDVYKHAADRFPDSRFVLTVRDSGSWWRSVNNWLTHKKPQLVETYQTQLRADSFTERDFIAGYERRNAEISDFFQGTDRLLTVDVTAGTAWEPICGFLGVPVPDAPFPHRNKQKYRD